MRPVARLAAFVVASILAVPAFAGFQSTVEYLVAVGRVAGQGGAQFYTTIWATNLTNSPVSFKLDFLKQGQANPSPASFSDTLAAGQTRMYENVVETKLGLTNAIQPNVADVVAGVSTINARITATVTGGTGSLILAGAQLANVSQDSSGFEMSFRDDILGSGGTAGVTSLNGLTGAVTLAAGSNITITPTGNALKIAATGGGGGGLTLPFSGSAGTDAGVPVFEITNSSAGYGIKGNASNVGVYR